MKDRTLYVAVNLGRFNAENGGVSEVWAYDVDDLSLRKKWKVPELVHGAGGMTWKGDGFYVVGGLPSNHVKNYVYEYTSDFKFVKRHDLGTGYTHLGIQTVNFIRDEFVLGCYSTRAFPIRTLQCPADFSSFKVVNADTNVGVVDLNGVVWHARTTRDADGLWSGHLISVSADR